MLIKDTEYFVRYGRLFKVIGVIDGDVLCKMLGRMSGDICRISYSIHVLFAANANVAGVTVDHSWQRTVKSDHVLIDGLVYDLIQVSGRWLAVRGNTVTEVTEPNFVEEVYYVTE